MMYRVMWAVQFMWKWCVVCDWRRRHIYFLQVTKKKNIKTILDCKQTWRNKIKITALLHSVFQIFSFILHQTVNGNAATDTWCSSHCAGWWSRASGGTWWRLRTSQTLWSPSAGTPTATRWPGTSCAPTGTPSSRSPSFKKKIIIIITCVCVASRTHANFCCTIASGLTWAPTPSPTWWTASPTSTPPGKCWTRWGFQIRYWYQISVRYQPKWWNILDLIQNLWFKRSDIISPFCSSASFL